MQINSNERTRSRHFSLYDWWKVSAVYDRSTSQPSSKRTIKIWSNYFTLQL